MHIHKMLQQLRKYEPMKTTEIIYMNICDVCDYNKQHFDSQSAQLLPQRLLQQLLQRLQQ